MIPTRSARPAVAPHTRRASRSAPPPGRAWHTQPPTMPPESRSTPSAPAHTRCGSNTRRRPLCAPDRLVITRHPAAVDSATPPPPRNGRRSRSWDTRTAPPVAAPRASARPRRVLGRGTGQHHPHGSVTGAATRWRVRALHDAVAAAGGGGRVAGGRAVVRAGCGYGGAAHCGDAQGRAVPGARRVRSAVAGQRAIREYAAYCQEHQASRLMEPERKELLRFVLGELGSENESALLGRALQTREDAVPEASREKDAVTDVKRAATAAGREDAVGGRPIERAPEEAAASVEQRVRAAMKRERVQRSMDSVLEVDARRRVDFSRLAVMDRLRAVLEDMRSGKARRAEASAERPAASAPTETVDIVRGDRYKADTQRAYREAGLGDVERLQIDPAASFSASEAWSTSAPPSAAPAAVTADVRSNAAIPVPR
eukprot:ctg_2446.g515